ncbi:alpha-amylase family glycosyl hydrolase [Daejeonella lutea]|uniref:Glycosidase n=1 Tax=Daejeonella lutea TaxID=572036 RepID=A0A1T5AK28_9SPHI|nr:alpha-amylase family glycosyl hydrolase [Daejeonella lutea]SKB35372.1 Glycosidase [Daejeonella lutea]
MKRNFTILLFTILSICCPIITLAQVQPVQYGKPFTKVPDRRDVSIYQVNIRTFSKEGNLKGVASRLDSIKALGFNVVYLMPIFPVGKIKAVNSPYCIQDYTSVNPEFGTLDDLRAVVDGAHKRGMSLILDWVANHTSYDHPWTKDKSWYLQNSNGNIISPPNMGWNDVAQLNFNNPEMRLASIAAMKYWVLAANVDGYRCDYSDGPPFDFWKQALDTLKNIKSRKLILLSEGRRSDHYAAGFDYNFGFRFFDNLKRIYKGNRSVLTIDSLNVSDYAGAEGGQQIVRYTSNHDVNGSDGTPLDLFNGTKGSLNAFMIVAYMKSIPMLYGGQEVGLPYRLTFPFTGRKIDWNLNPDITAQYKKIIAFRNSSVPIRRGTLTSYSTADVCAFTKEAGNKRVFVVSNLRNTSLSYTIPEKIVNSKWDDAFTGTKIKLTNTITLEPYSYFVYKN